MKQVIPLIALFLYCYALPTTALYQYNFPIDVIGHKYLGETHLTKDNSLVGRTITTFEKKSFNGNIFLIVTARANGIVQNKSFSSELVRHFILKDGQITSHSLTGSTTSGGMPWTDFSIFYDWQNMTAAVQYQDHSKNENINKTVSLSPDLVTIQDLDLYLSSLPTRNIREEKIQTLLPNGQTFGFLLKLSNSTETLEVNGQKFICRRIEMKPDIWLIGFLFPGVNYWLNNFGHHELVRFSGMVGGPGSPDVTQNIWREE